MNKFNNIWGKVNFPDDCDRDCEYLIETKDCHGTGDSPSQFECQCSSAINCPIVADSIGEYED